MALPSGWRAIILPMIDPKMELLSTVVVQAVVRLEADEQDTSAWEEIQSAVQATEDEDTDLAAALEARSVEQLRDLAEQWASGKKHLPVSDRGVLKRAMKAFRKSLNVTRLMHDSSIGGGPLSNDRDSEIVGIQPPPRYPEPVWRELSRQGRLVANHVGTYELPPSG